MAADVEFSEVFLSATLSGRPCTSGFSLLVLVLFLHTGKLFFLL